MKRNQLSTNKGNMQKGFSILEVIISIAILSIGILATARMQTVAVRSTSLASRITVDSIAAQDLIERVVSAPYSDPSLTDTNDNGASGLDNEGSAADFYMENQVDHYKLSMNIADDQPIANSKLVRVIVETRAPGGSKKTTYNFIKSRLTRP